MLERSVEDFFVRRCRETGTFTRKLEWIGRVGAPDRIAIHDGKVIFVELKAPGKKARTIQTVEHNTMREHGADVFVADSFEQVDRIMAYLVEGYWEMASDF